MTADDFKQFLVEAGLTVETMVGNDGQSYILVRDLTIPNGSLAGRVCDVAIACAESVPYIPPAAIHTKPALVPMNSAAPLATQPSGIGEDWQYWSRRFDRPPTPKSLWAHVLTILCDPSWPSS